MGSVVRYSRQRAPARFAPRPRRKSRPYVPGVFLIVGVAILAASMAGKTFKTFAPSGATQPAAALAQVRVIDGDTLRAGDESIRLIGIDAPERAQTCRDANNREWRCGAAATARLVALVARGNVACAPQGRDRYGRTLAVCSAGDVADLGRLLVREGYAVNYAFDTPGYILEEVAARIAGRGLWQGAFERPQDWRRRHRRSGEG